MADRTTELVAKLLTPKPRRPRNSQPRACGPSRPARKRKLRLDKLEGRHVSETRIGGALTIALVELDGTPVCSYEISDAFPTVWHRGRQFWLWGVERSTDEVVYVPAPPEN